MEDKEINTVTSDARRQDRVEQRRKLNAYCETRARRQDRLNQQRDVVASVHRRADYAPAAPVVPIIKERNACPYGYACPYPPAPQQQAAPAVATDNTPEYLSPYDVAAIYNLNINTVYQLIHDGKFDAFRIGRCWRVDAKSVKRAFNID